MTGCEKRSFPSSTDVSLTLSAEFFPSDTPKPLCLFFPGWHMTAAESSRAGYPQVLARDYFVVNMDMRGRGASGGTPDASGHELLDGLDGLDFARRTWPERVDAGRGPYVAGGSGGGGNTLALAGKAPDRFAAAVAWAGMSDYALWYAQDSAGVYRDEMVDRGWIGDTPENAPHAYAARGGIHVLENLLTPLLVVHGRKDEAVPPAHTERYEARARELGKSMVEVVYTNAAHGSQDWPLFMGFLARHTIPPALPWRGVLKVHGFLDCHPFRLVLDRPDAMGIATYALRADGRLRTMTFAPAAGCPPPRCATLRLPAGSGAPRVRAGGSDVPLHATPCGALANHLIPCDGPWQAELGG